MEQATEKKLPSMPATSSVHEIPSSGNVRKRLSENIREARLLRSLLRLAIRADKEFPSRGM